MSRRAVGACRFPFVWDPGLDNQGFILEEGDKLKKNGHTDKHSYFYKLSPVSKCSGKPTESRLHRIFRKNLPRRKSESQKADGVPESPLDQMHTSPPGYKQRRNSSPVSDRDISSLIPSPASDRDSSSWVTTPSYDRDSSSLLTSPSCDRDTSSWVTSPSCDRDSTSVLPSPSSERNYCSWVTIPSYDKESSSWVTNQANERDSSSWMTSLAKERDSRSWVTTLTCQNDPNISEDVRCSRISPIKSQDSGYSDSEEWGRTQEVYPADNNVKKDGQEEEEEHSSRGSYRNWEENFPWRENDNILCESHLVAESQDLPASALRGSNLPEKADQVFREPGNIAAAREQHHVSRVFVSYSPDRPRAEDDRQQQMTWGGGRRQRVGAGFLTRTTLPRTHPVQPSAFKPVSGAAESLGKCQVFVKQDEAVLRHDRKLGQGPPNHHRSIFPAINLGREASNPVQQWMNELPSLSEPECTNMLQSKSLQTDRIFGASTIENLTKLQNQAVALSSVFAVVCRNMEKMKKREIFSGVRDLETGLRSIIRKYNSWRYEKEIDLVIAELPGLKLERKNSPEILLSLQQRIFHLLYRIKISVSRVTSRNLEEVVDLLREFGTVFSDLIETLLSEIVRESIQTLGKSKTETALKDSLLLVSKLGLEGNHICRLFAREGGVEVLLRILGESASSNHRGLILRTLGTLCSVKESIKEFESLDGLEVLAGVLRDEQEERILMEAAGVLAQITSPWIENSLDAGKVEEHAYDIVSSLTKLSSFTKSSETFLLCTAALANLGYLSPLMLTAMSQLETITPLLSFIYHSVSPSIYILDQIATILANLSASHHTRDLLPHHDIVPALLLLLAADPGSTDRSYPLLSATQRVQQKAAIAIGRLAVYPSVCQGILSGGGLERLVELSVCREARIDSDYTLVSVVTAVRKISQVVDILPDIRKLGAQDILDSNILHSLQVYGPMQESFV